jgi:formate-dependent phosphoribosylglycinamide formyltransferase (GAR transformylase)
VSRTVLFVGAGRHQRRAIERAQELGLRVVAVDRNPDALGLRAADEAEVVDFADVDAVVEVARRHAVDGALTVSPTVRFPSSRRSRSASACRRSGRRSRT